MAKWAQMTPIERAYERAKKAEGYCGRFSHVGALPRWQSSVREKRECNRYYQLLGHWCDLKKASDAQSS